MRWYIRRLDSLINPKCPRPYLGGFDAIGIAYWVEHRSEAFEMSDRHTAFYNAQSFGNPSIPWRERVRIVRVREREAR